MGIGAPHEVLPAIFWYSSDSSGAPGTTSVLPGHSADGTPTSAVAVSPDRSRSPAAIRPIWQPLFTHEVRKMVCSIEARSLAHAKPGFP
jgi:hypothetical protein